MNSIFMMLSGLSFLLGIFLLFLAKAFTAILELAYGVGINDINEYGFSYYAISCFVLGVLFPLVFLFGNFSKK
ncbi:MULTISPECIES: hypothetical protein [Bacillus]|uniref:hypothetical protein n=1 Tax=Bacillus TaxID=1386 RepID=UPI00119DC505|nr:MULTISPECIES: hypothetical protein [Bacillus]MCP1150872.1 hypothetical protein [Bacillus sp. 1735sda2]